MDDAWFTILRSPGQIRITPANGKGWISFGVMLIALLLPLVVVIPYARYSMWVPIAHVVFGLVVMIAFVRFAWTRADMIDVTALMRDAQRQMKERQQRKEG